MTTSAWAQAPTVTAVVNDASADAGLSPGVRAKVHYTNATPSDGRHFPEHNETVFVQVGGHKALVLGAGGGGSATVLLPREAPPGPATLVITNSAGRSEPFNITLDTYSPGLQEPGLYCRFVDPLERGAVLNAVGLGPADPELATYEAPGVFGLIPTKTRPTVTVAGRDAEVVSSMLLRRGAGSYVVTYKVPPGLPEGRHPVTLTIGGKTSNTVHLLLSAAVNYLATGGKLNRAAPESIVSAYACSTALAKGEFTGDLRTPQTSLGGTTVTVTDSAGVERAAAVSYVFPSQVNYVVPSGAAAGTATVAIRSSTGTVQSTLEIDPLEPGMFVGPGWGSGRPAGHIVRVRDGVQTFEPTDPGVDANGDTLPIALGEEGEDVYLVWFGTGLRFRSSVSKVMVRIADIELPVEYAGPQREYLGVDQVNVRLPKLLPRHTDPLPVYVQVDGKTSNRGSISLK